MPMYVYGIIFFVTGRYINHKSPTHTYFQKCIGVKYPETHTLFICRQSDYHQTPPSQKSPSFSSRRFRPVDLPREALIPTQN